MATGHDTALQMVSAPLLLQPRTITRHIISTAAKLHCLLTRLKLPLFTAIATTCLFTALTLLGSDVV